MAEMTSLIERLEAGEILVSDGAMSTMLQKMGLTSETCPEQWNTSNPEAVAAVHRSYVLAGSDIICTNSCGGNPLKLDRYGLSGRTAELNAAGVRLAKEAAGDKVLVAASVGPTGRLLEPLGDLSADEARAAFAEQVGAATSAGADAILFETFFDLAEAEQAIKAALPFGTPIICTMTFDANGRTLMGTDAASAARALVGFGVRVVGANCGLGPEAMLPLVRQMAASGAFVMMQPNAGLPSVGGGEVAYSVTPETMADYAVRFVDSGAGIVGGCCGSTPEHIAAIVKAVKQQMG